MGIKKLQGSDGMEFQMQMTVAGLEGINFNEELKNKAGNDIVKVNCWGGRLSAFVNLPHALRPNNVQPFQLSDCIHMELVRNQVVEFMRSCLQKNLKDKYSEKFLSQLTVTKLEANLTIACVGECKPKDVIRLFEKAFLKVTVYKETDDKGKPHKKPERGITTTKPHMWCLKVYDKSYQLRKGGDLKVEPNLIRVELVFLDRMLNQMYSNKRSLEDILTRKAIKILIDQYKTTFDEICAIQLKNVLNNCMEEVFESLTISTSGKEISDTVTRCKEFILDIEILRKALRKWYKFRDMTDNSKQVLSYYRNGNFGIPRDVLKTVKLMHNSM